MPDMYIRKLMPCGMPEAKPLRAGEPCPDCGAMMPTAVRINPEDPATCRTRLAMGIAPGTPLGYEAQPSAHRTSGDSDIPGASCQSKDRSVGPSDLDAAVTGMFTPRPHTVSCASHVGGRDCNCGAAEG